MKVSPVSASGSCSDEKESGARSQEPEGFTLRGSDSWLLAPDSLKILIANIGSTSLKWRLFDFSNGAETLLHKGGFERVTDYSKAIEDCLAQLKEAKAIASESELAAVGDRKAHV